MAPALSKEFLDIQANYKVWIHSETLTWHDNMDIEKRQQLRNSHQAYYMKKVLLKILQNSQQNNCVRVSFLIKL